MKSLKASICASLLIDMSDTLEMKCLKVYTVLWRCSPLKHALRAISLVT